MLSCLSVAPNHGYGVILWAATISPEDPRLSIGSVYGAIEALEGSELIELHEETVENGRSRRVMRITPPGAKVLVSELARLQRELDATTASAIADKSAGANA